MNMFDATLDDESNYRNLLNEVSIFGLNCLEMAVIGNRKKFVATELVQNLLTQIWNGKVTSKTDLATRIQVKKKSHIHCFGTYFITYLLLKRLDCVALRLGFWRLFWHSNVNQ